MNSKSDRVMRWRHRTKQRLIDAFGGKCGICGYNKCRNALEFHHLDPDSKEFHWGTISGSIRGWDFIVQEMKKCVLLCSNCHREVHSVTEPTPIPDNIAKFNPVYESYKVKMQLITDECPVCGSDKRIGMQYCSQQCAKKKQRKVDWDSVDLPALLQEHNGY